MGVLVSLVVLMILVINGTTTGTLYKGRGGVASATFSVNDNSSRLVARRSK